MRWLTRPEITLSPLAAAALVILLVGGALWVARPARELAGTETSAAVPVRHQFVLVAPRATSVALVGDFNEWRIGATQLERQGSVWTVELTLPPGRHVYSFVVDGEEWVADASAPRAPEDEFGRPSSVILVARRRT